MALKTVSIGTAIDIYQFDDGDTEYGVDTTGKVRAGTAPTNNDEVVRLQDLGNYILNTGLSTDNAIVRFDGDTGKIVQNSGVIIDDTGKIYPLSAKIGGAVNYTNFDGDGVLSLHGDARISYIQQIHLSSMKKGVGSPPGDGIKDGFPTLDFSSGADEEVFFSFVTPLAYDVSTNLFIHLLFFVDTAPATPAGVAWAIEWKAIAPGETVDFTVGTDTIVQVCPITTGSPTNDALLLDCDSISGGAGTVAPSDLLFCRLYRDTSDPGDTFANDVRLIGSHVNYIANKLGTPI